MKKQQTSLSELARHLGVNKSKLAYWFSLGLLKPIAKVGRMNIFDLEASLKALKKIEVSKKLGKKLKEIK